MRYSKYIISIFLLFSCLAGFSQNIITVTDKADSGPGTLRAALITAAGNGSAVQDIIKFNLPGAGLNSNIIRLRSQLPVVTSNVTIDGGTQPGQNLGVSGARIIIEPELPLFSGFSCLVIGSNPYVGTNIINFQTTDVEIYGLYIRKFAILTNLQTVNVNAQISGIILDYRVDRIKIGAAGRGNVIGGNTNGILLRNNSNNSDLQNKQDNITIQGNLIGITDDGFTDESNFVGINADISYAALIIGGDATADGNVIAANGTDISLVRNFNTSSPMLLNIFNNHVGTDFSGKRAYKNIPLFSGSSTVQMNGIRIIASNTTANISKNIISGHLTTGLSISNAEFLITGNKIGTGISGSETNMGNGSGIRIEGSATGTIGGSADPDPNYIAYNTFGVESFSNRSVKITRNSIYCNTNVGIAKVTSAPQAYIQVLKINPGYISGKANAGAEIELFYTDDCPGSCQGKTYLATVRAGVDGRWRYDGPINGKVTGTASITNGVTSQFSTAGLLPNEAIVEPLTCLGLGSVTINEPREGITFSWYKLEADGTAGFIGDTQSMPGLDVGNYEVRIGDGCSEATHRFAITDQIITDLIVTTPTPLCGQTSFTFTASVFRGKGVVRFVWTDEAGGFVGGGNSLPLPEGTYKVTATDEAGCSKFYQFPKIEKKLKLYIKPPTLSQSARCGKTDGFIRGITVGDDEGLPITYTWYYYSYVNGIGIKGTQIKTGSDPDLIDIPSGYYLLEATSAASCSPATPMIRLVGETKSVKINIGATVNTTCNNSNGAISNIVIQEGDTWKLTNSLGQEVRSGVCVPGVPFNIPNLTAGTYILNASSSITHCVADPVNRSVGATPITVYTVTQTPSILFAACGLDNGSIRLTYTGLNRPAENRCVWRNEAGDVFPGTSTELKNLDEGSYTLHIVDENGCNSPLLGPYEVKRIELLIVDQMSGTVIDDQCALGRGGVTGVKITGGSPISGSGPDAVYSYVWKDLNGTKVGSKRDLDRVGAGQYYLEVSDQTVSRCGIYTSKVFTIAAPVIPLENPIINSVRVCYATEVMLPIIGADEGTYQMFLNETDTRPILETTNGRFIYKVAKTGDYVIRRKLGSCYSGFTPLHIEVTNDNLDIRNTMTPNGDGKNDYWMITGLPDHDVNIKVYTRSGQLVYESLKRYDIPFDGRFRGKELPAGAYYYKIDLRSDCNPIGGSITLLR